MKTLAALLALFAFAAAPALADDTHHLGENTTLILGYKLWANEWHTVTPSFGGGYDSIATQGVLHIPSLSLKYKNWLFSGSEAISGKYPFPMYSDRNLAGGQTAENVQASRHETDLNVGYYVIPQLAVTVGYKNVEQHYDVTSTIKGGFNGTSTSKTHYNGVTFGVAGSAPIGHGWALYGSGVGGIMDVTYTPSSVAHDFANYVGSELGFAWKTPDVPLSFTIGYKYQIINTHVNVDNDQVGPGKGIHNQTGVDMTQGWVLGTSYFF